MRHVLLLLVLPFLFACRGTRPSSFADEAGSLVLVKEARIPDSEAWYARFATHAWFDVRDAGSGGWTRIEISSPHSGVQVNEIAPESALSDTRWRNRRVRVRGVLRGDEARDATQALLESAAAYDDEGYRAIPGPNSNTFVAELIDAAPHLRTTLHHNAVGKDYLPPVGVARTPSKTGVRLDSGWLGFALGLQEGVELHLAGLQLGVGIWPPRIEIPFLLEIGPAVPANGR
jgi:uncharacterized protein DUF3750